MYCKNLRDKAKESSQDASYMRALLDQAFKYVSYFELNKENRAKKSQRGSHN